MNGLPFIWEPYINQLKKTNPNIHCFAPHIYKSGNCSLKRASAPLLEVISDYRLHFPYNPVALVGISNGARIAAKLEKELAGEKVADRQLHGTGCTFASALAAQLAAGRSLVEAATLSKAYVTKAIEKAYAVGKGRLPLDHFYRQKIEPLVRGTHELPTHGMHPAESGH